MPSTGSSSCSKDQFAVGDFIRVGGQSGTVEEMSLRRTVIRSADGAAITIPNSEIRTVENLSKDWSRAVVEVAVAPEANERRVMEILTEMLGDIHEDPEFADDIVEPANVRRYDGGRAEPAGLSGDDQDAPRGRNGRWDARFSVAFGNAL